MNYFSFSHATLKHIVEDINKSLSGSYLKKIISSSHRFFFILENNHRRACLCFSMRPQCPALFLTNQIPHSGFNSPFFQKIELLLQESLLHAIQIDPADRIITLFFQKKVQIPSPSFLCLHVQLFPLRTNCYLNTNQDSNPEFFLYPVVNPSTTRKKPFILQDSSSSTIAALLEKLNNTELHKQVETIINNYERSFDFDLIKNSCVKLLKRKLAIIKKRSLIQIQSLQECQSYATVLYQADLLKANLHNYKKGLSELTVMDWESGKKVTLNLTTHKSIQEQLEGIYKRAKRLKSGINPLKLAIEKTEKERLETSHALEKLQQIQSLPELTLFRSHWGLPLPADNNLLSGKKQSSGTSNTSLCYKQFFSQANIAIWVGKSAADNHLLTFHLARGSDLWLHIVGHSGPHVIVRSSKNQPIDEQTLQDAAHLAVYYSRIKRAPQVIAEVSFTRRKNVHATPKKGKVSLAQRKLLTIELDLERIKRLIETATNHSSLLNR